MIISEWILSKVQLLTQFAHHLITANMARTEPTHDQALFTSSSKGVWRQLRENPYIFGLASVSLLLGSIHLVVLSSLTKSISLPLSEDSSSDMTKALCQAS